MVLDMFLLELPATFQKHSGACRSEVMQGLSLLPALGGLCRGWERAGMLSLYHPVLNVTLQKDALMKLRDNTG